MEANKLRDYIETLIQRGSSAAELARKCDISSAALSQFRAGKYGAKEDALADKIAVGLNYYDNTWKIVETVSSYKQVKLYLMAAKKNHRWFCISSRSGSGKTHSLIDLYNTCPDNSIIYLKCWKWTAKKFLQKLGRCLGITFSRYTDTDDMLQQITSCINRMADRYPVLVLDDAGKLSNSAMACLIPLYDDTKYRMGCVLAGTETLRRTIKRNVGRVDGFDEIDGRVVRNYITLLGATKKDVRAICAANGVTDPDEQDEIWGKLDKVEKLPTEDSRKSAWFVDDLRELEGMIMDKVIPRQVQNGEIQL